MEMLRYHGGPLAGLEVPREAIADTVLRGATGFYALGQAWLPSPTGLVLMEVYRWHAAPHATPSPRTAIVA